MKKKPLHLLWVIPLLIGFLVGLSPVAKAAVDPKNPFLSVTLTPTPGTITDINDLQTITFHAPEGGYHLQIGLKNILYLRKVDESGAVSNVAKYQNSTLSDDKTELTYTLASDISTLDLEAGEYQVYIKNKNTIIVADGDLGAPCGNLTADVIYTFEYAPAPAVEPVDPKNPFASVTVSPVPGNITNLSNLQTVTFNAPAGGYHIKANTLALYPIWLRQVDAEGNATNLVKYSTAVQSEDKTSVTLTLAKDINTLGLQPGEYQVYIQKKNTIVVYDGDLPAQCGNLDTDVVYTYTYDPGATAEIEWSITPSRYAQVPVGEFTGVKVNFENASKVELNPAVATDDAISVKLNGEAYAQPTRNADNVTFTWPNQSSFKGAMSVKIPEGYYNVTLKNGKTATSPEISTSFLFGKIEKSSNPLPDALVVTRPPSAISTGTAGITAIFPQSTKARVNYDLIKGAYYQVGDSTFTYNNDDPKLCISVDGENVCRLERLEGYSIVTKATPSKLYFPEGSYFLTIDDEEFPSPMVTADFYRVPEEIMPTIGTIPANAAQIDKLTEFSVSFAGVSDLHFKGSGIPSRESITLTYGDKVLYYGDDFTVSPDEITKMVLKAPITTLTPTDVTLHFDNAIYEFTLADGTVVNSPNVESTFKVGINVKYTVNPASYAYVDPLTSFNIDFTGVKEVAWANPNELPQITFTCGDVHLSYTEGFTEGDEITQMVLDTPLTYVTPKYGNFKFAAGVYMLTYEDGSQALSPEISWTCYIGSKTNYTTTPAKNATVGGLSTFSINFTDAKEVAWGNPDKLPQITLTYDDNTLSYTNGFTEGDEITEMVLEKPVKPDGLVSAKMTFGEGTYKLTFEDGTERLSPEISVAFKIDCEPVMNFESWVPVTNLDQLDKEDGLECVLVWYYNGYPLVQLAPGMNQSAPMVTRKTESCAALSTEVMQTSEIQIARGGVAITNFLTTGEKKDNSKRVIAINKMPASAALITIKKEAEGYTLYNSNCANPGYLAPGLDKNLARAFLNTEPDPYYNTITVDTEGKAFIVSNYRDDQEGYNILSAMSNYTQQTIKFEYVQQELNLGNLYIFTKATPEILLAINGDPASGSKVEATADGKYDINFSVGRFPDAVRNADSSAPTATFEGEALSAEAFVLSEGYPATANVTLPGDTTGTLTIDFPAGWCNVNVDGEVTPTPAYTYTLNIVKEEKLPVADITVEITPADGETVAKIGEITLTFPSTVKSVAINDEIANNGGVTALLNGKATSTPVMVNNTTFRYRPEMSDAGRFTFRLAEGFYTLTMEDGTLAQSPEIQTIVTVDPRSAVLDVNYGSVPAKGSTVPELKEFSVYFPVVMNVDLTDMTDDDAVTLSYDNTVLTYPKDFNDAVSVNNSGDVTTMIMAKALTFDTPTEVTVNFKKGFYQLTLTDGTIGVSPAIEFTFTVDKNSSLGTHINEADSSDVYTLDGICVLRDASDADIQQLPAGIYIYNKRVMIKK